MCLGRVRRVFDSVLSTITITISSCSSLRMQTQCNYAKSVHFIYGTHPELRELRHSCSSSASAQQQLADSSCFSSPAACMRSDSTSPWTSLPSAQAHGPRRSVSRPRPSRSVRFALSVFHLFSSRSSAFRTC